MEKPNVLHSTFVLEHSYPASPERVFAAFADPNRKKIWYGDAAGRAVEKFTTDFRIGGVDHYQYRMLEGTPFPGAVLENQTCYQDIVPNKRIVLAYTMSLGGNRFSASLATFEFVPTEKGTDLVFTDQGAYFENSDGPRMREGGWRSLLGKLADAVAD